MPKDSMFYATLEEAIDAAREEFLANNPDSDEESANVEQLNIQKYVLQDGELTTAPPVQKKLPEKPGYLFRLTLGLHPDIGDDRTVTLDLPAAEAELLDAQEQLGTLNWENTVVLNYDGILPLSLIHI